MSDEDFDPFVGGPPPDPSERTWRHPSELAAQANADAMSADRRDTIRSRHAVGIWPRNRSLGFLLAGSIGAAVCITTVAVLQLVDSADGDLDPAAIGVSDAIEIGPLDGENPQSSRASTVISTPAAESPATTATPTTMVTPTAMVTPTTASASTPTTAPNPAVIGAAKDHVVAIATGSEPVASGVVLDGYVLTSTSAVGDQLSITIVSDHHRPAPAYLVGIDPFSDLAVYRPSIAVRSSEAWSAFARRALDTSGLSPVAAPTADTRVDGVPLAAAAGEPVFLASATPDGSTIDLGIIMDIGSEGETPSGQSLVGLIDTSIRRPANGEGSLLLGADGSPLGIVVDSASSLASAVPVADALLIAERLTDQGWANESWFGFVGMDIDDGVEVVDVTRDGPAGVAGLQPGDIIAFVDGSPIDHMGSVTADLRRAEPGDSVVIVVERAGEFVSVRVTAEAYGGVDRLTEPVDG